MCCLFIFFNSKNKYEGTSLLCHACGVHDDAIVRDILDDVARGTRALAYVKLVALVVSRFCVFPQRHFQALLHQLSIGHSRKQCLPPFVPLTLPHINAATTFLRVFAYVRALNTVCSCPLGSVGSIDFFHGRAFHHLCNLYDSGDTASVQEMFSGSMWFYRNNDRWCTRFLKESFVLPRIPEVAFVPDVSALKSAPEPAPAAADPKDAAATSDSLLQAFESLTLDDPDHGEASACDD